MCVCKKDREREQREREKGRNRVIGQISITIHDFTGFKSHYYLQMYTQSVHTYFIQGRQHIKLRRQSFKTVTAGINPRKTQFRVYS